MNIKSSLVEENPFNEEIIAKEWIRVVEDSTGVSRSRRDFFYPLLGNRTSKYEPNLIVEIGAGQGICSEYLWNYRKYIGIEPSAHLRQRAKEKYEDQRRFFIEGTAYELPLQDEVSDFVFSSMVWFHLKDLVQASLEMSRVLKKNKPFLLTTAHPSMYSTWQSFFENPEVDEEKMVGKIYTPTGSMQKNIIYKHSQDYILSSLINAGLMILNVEGFGYNEEHEDDGIFLLIEGVKKGH